MTSHDAAAHAQRRLCELDAHAIAAGRRQPSTLAPDELSASIVGLLRSAAVTGLNYRVALRVAAEALALVLAVDAAETVDVTSGEAA